MCNIRHTNGIFLEEGLHEAAGQDVGFLGVERGSCDCFVGPDEDLETGFVCGGYDVSLVKIGQRKAWEIGTIRRRWCSDKDQLGSLRFYIIGEEKPHSGQQVIHP